MYAEVAMLQTLLEGVPLPAHKRDLIRYALEQDDHAPLALLERLPDREYEKLDDVGEALLPVQPAAQPPVRVADRWRGFGGTGRFHRRGAKSRVDRPPGGDDYVSARPVPGAIRHDAPPDNPPQKAIAEQSKRQKEQKERQKRQLAD